MIVRIQVDVIVGIVGFWGILREFLGFLKDSEGISGILGILVNGNFS